jgi:hypothetical protein
MAIKAMSVSECLVHSAEARNLMAVLFRTHDVAHNCALVAQALPAPGGAVAICCEANKIVILEMPVSDTSPCHIHSQRRSQARAAKPPPVTREAAVKGRRSEGLWMQSWVAETLLRGC